jgi:hypothetical protein
LKFLTACITGAPLPAPPPDWDALLRLADYHRVTPLLARATRAYPLPDRVRRALQTAARANAQRNLLLFAHTARISSAFASSGIDALFLKGPLLAHRIYGDLSLRVCGDVDVLVRAAQFVEASVLLTRLGYDAGTQMDANELRKHLRFQHDLPFAHADGTLVELHADLAQPHYSYRADLGPWFHRTRILDVSGHSIPTPAPGHDLLLAIIHGTKHVWTRLDLLADTAAIIRQPLDWDLVHREIRSAGATRAAAVAGYLLRNVLSVSTPLLAMNDGFAARIARAAAQRLVQQRDPTWWQTRSFDLAVRERASDRLRYVTKLYRKWSAA